MTDAASGDAAPPPAEAAPARPHRGTILFAQLDRFSYTNDALAEHLAPRLQRAGYRLEGVRVYRRILANPAYAVACLAAVLFYFGPRAMVERRRLNERFVKTPFFFRLAGRYLRREAQRLPDFAGVFQTQGLFDAHVPGHMSVIYTDNTILNPINAGFGGLTPRRGITGLERSAYHKAARMTVASGHVRQSLIEDYGVPAERIEVVHIGTNTPPVVAPEPGRFTSGRILFVGIDWERKGGPELVEAFRTLRQRHAGLELTIVGANPPLDEPGVVVRGRVPPEEVSRLLARSAIFVMPSRLEPMGIAPVEAARAGLPVVATRSGGLVDTVVDGETGFLVPEQDSAAIAAALDRLLRDPALCEAMGRRGAAWVERFDWPTVCDRLAEIIVAAAEGRDGPQGVASS